MSEVQMITVDCPWCEAPLALEGLQQLRCEKCAIEVDVVDPSVAAELPVAA